MPFTRPQNNPSVHRILEVERSTDGVVVTFEDCRTAVFDPDWLYQQIPHAKLVLESEDEDSLPIKP
jgi:hypothetical protein